jgi:hypothetical protein
MSRRGFQSKALCAGLKPPSFEKGIIIIVTSFLSPGSHANAILPGCEDPGGTAVTAILSNRKLTYYEIGLFRRDAMLYSVILTYLISVFLFVLPRFCFEDLIGGSVRNF